MTEDARPTYDVEWKKGDVVQDPLGRVWERSSRYIDSTYVWRDFTGGWIRDEALPRPLVRMVPEPQKGSS